MNPRDSGHKGGTATRDNHPTLCSLCGSLIKSRFFSENGAQGGQATLERYGREHFVRAGRMGGRGNKKIYQTAESSGSEIQEEPGVTSSLLTEDVVEIHHKHTPIRVFETIE